jgi:hypothetical protein
MTPDIYKGKEYKSKDIGEAAYELQKQKISHALGQNGKKIGAACKEGINHYSSELFLNNISTPCHYFPL